MKKTDEQKQINKKKQTNEQKTHTNYESTVTIPELEQNATTEK